MIKKVENAVSWMYVNNDHDGEEIAWTFNKKELQETNEKDFRIEKLIKKKVINLMLNEKDSIIDIIVAWIKNT